MVYCYYYIIPEENNGFLAERLMAAFPPHMQDTVSSHKHTEEQLRIAAGKALLEKGLKDFLLHGDFFQRLQYDDYMRPFLPGGPDFNIAHSGRMVLCAIADKGKVGVDTEMLQTAPVSDYEYLFTAVEWKTITENIDPADTFYRFWTRKEAVLKAIGKGLHIEPASIDVSGSKTIWEGQTYSIREIMIHKGYKTCLAITADAEIQLKEIFL